jgi:hypothetical protein
MIALHPGPHDRPVVPVDIPESLVQPPSAGVVDPHSQSELLVAEPAGGDLGRADQRSADTPPPERSQSLQVGELRHTGKMPAGQAVGEPVALSQDRHQRGKVGLGPWPDLHLRSHEAQPSEPVEPVYLFPYRCPAGHG